MKNKREKRYIKCEYCQERKPQVLVDTPNNKVKTDIIDPYTKKSWSGRTPKKATICPECVELMPSLGPPKLKLTNRQCNCCGEFLTEDKYFNCSDCLELIEPTINQDFLYESVPDTEVDEEFFETLKDLGEKDASRYSSEEARYESDFADEESSN